MLRLFQNLAEILLTAAKTGGAKEEDVFAMTLDYFYGQAGELFSFFRIPKALFQEQRFQDLSTDAKTLYGILLDRMSLSVKNGWLDEQNRVFIIFTMQKQKKLPN